MRYDILSLTDTRQVSLCGTNVYPSPEYHPDRVMQEHDLMLMCEGEWTVVQDQTAYNIHAGDMIYLRAGSHHYGPTFCSPNAKTMFIHFNKMPDDRSDVELSAPELGGYVTGRFVCLPTVTHCGTNIQDRMLDIINMYWSHRDDRERQQNLLLNLLLAELAFAARRSPIATEKQNWVFTLLQTLRAEPARYFSLEEAAELVHMSVRSISARFRKVMGMSFHQYQADMKLQMAYNTLESGLYSVKQVADMYGFCDPYYFSRVFKKQYGMAPKELKRQNPADNIDRPWMK